MILHVVNASYVDGYRIEVTFNDGRTGIADLEGTLDEPAFEKLKDRSEFKNFKVDDELDTLVWENGADLAPEYIYYQAFKDDAKLQEKFRNWGYLTN